MAYDWHLFIIFLDSRQTEMPESACYRKVFNITLPRVTASFSLGRSGRGGTRVAGATPTMRPVPLAQLQPDQEAIGQHHRGCMPVEARPQSPLVLIQAHFSFGLFMKLFDGIAPMGIPSQLFRHGRGRQIAPVVLPLLRLATGRTLSQQPSDMKLAPPA
jgi:hypothetical protein